MRKQQIFGLVVLVLLPGWAWSQVYMEAKTQHRFAQTYFGVNVQYVPAGGELLWKGERRAFPAIAAPRVTVGGLHFWGKVDFNMNFPLHYFGQKALDATSEVEYYPGADLSARFYPWRMEYRKVRPYVGASFNDMTLEISDTDRGDRQDLFVTSSLVGGFSYADRGWQVNAEVMWMPQTERPFYADHTTPYTLRLPSTYVSVGVVKYFDGTLHEERRLAQTAELEKKLLKERKLNSISLAIAPSGTYFLKVPQYQDPVRQSVARHKGNFNWELGVGYLFHEAEMHLGLAYRGYSSRLESYGVEHIIRRQSLALEAFWFLWDFNGFRPYVGPSIGLERWATGEFVDDVQVGDTQRTRMISPGILFGWDIVASPLETWVLRTNLRYYPFQEIVNIEGSRSRVDQFEFNFIELVVYPQRWYHIGRAR